METGKIYHGFELRRVRRIDELDGELYEFSHAVTGAEVAWINREDENMAFGIAFKTIPENSTGVFHILEHSVLCGSAKYPIKDPFVELLKSSVNTFLNAMTYPDKTVYPISSRNRKDFLNLMDIYLDAVLHPNIYTNPSIFRQEGWRYEINEENVAEYQGVVLNEMKGAYSDPDELLMTKMQSLIFPDTTYRHDSGGEPSTIPDLTYEHFIEMHKKYYHPSNSRTILVGSVDIDAALAKLEEFFAPYERLDADFSIPFQRSVEPKTERFEYEIGAEEDPKGRGMIGIGWLLGTFEEQEKVYAANILADYLAGDNDAPLKKAILEKGLAEDVDFSVNDGIQELAGGLIFRNTDEDKLDEIRKTVREVLSEIADKGVEEKRIRASYNRFAFKLRDKDSGFSRSLAEGLTMLDSWLYGGDPALYLTCDKALGDIERNMAAGGYFEELIRVLLLDNRSCVTGVLVPSTTLGEAKLADERARVKARQDKWSEAELEEKKAELSAVRAWQQTPDSEEDKAKIPVLALSDIDPTPKDITPNVASVDGVTVLESATGSSLANMDLWFECSDVGADELWKAALLTKLISKLPTEDRTSAELQSEAKARIGRLSFDTAAFRTKSGDVRAFLTVSMGALAAEGENAASLIAEMLTKTRFDDKQAVKNLLAQTLNELKMALIGAGHMYGILRTGASISGAGMAKEQLGGASFIEKLRKLTEDAPESLGGELKAMAEKLFCRARLTVGASEEAKSAAKKLIAALPEGEASAKSDYAPVKTAPAGIAIPAPVAYAVKGAAFDGEFSGASYVFQNILTFSYLWNEVRVLGGAYGTGFRQTPEGESYYYSYRDPKPARSLGVYDKAADFMREFLASDPDLTAPILAATKAFDPLLNVRTQMYISEQRYLNGTTYEDIARIAREVISASKADLLSLCETLDKCAGERNITVIAGKHMLDTCDGLEITEI